MQYQKKTKKLHYSLLSFFANTKYVAIFFSFSFYHGMYFVLFPCHMQTDCIPLSGVPVPRALSSCKSGFYPRNHPLVENKLKLKLSSFAWSLERMQKKHSRCFKRPSRTTAFHGHSPGGATVRSRSARRWSLANHVPDAQKQPQLMKTWIVCVQNFASRLPKKRHLCKLTERFKNTQSAAVQLQSCKGLFFVYKNTQSIFIQAPKGLFFVYCRVHRVFVYCSA